MHLFCVSTALHFGPSEHELNRLIFYSCCASSERLMKMQAWVTRGKLHLKDKIENFLWMSLWLQPVIGLDSRFCVSTAWRGRRHAPALKLFQSRNETVLSIMQFSHKVFTLNSPKCVVGTTNGKNLHSVQLSSVFAAPFLSLWLIFNTAAAH